jgi:hypothetical protein
VARDRLGFSPDMGTLPLHPRNDTGGTISRGFFGVHRGGILLNSTSKHRFSGSNEMRLISQDSALEVQKPR